MTAQCDIDQQIRRSCLVEYVAGFGSMSEPDAVAWLDANFPVWRSGIEPQANKIEVDDGNDDDH